MDLKCVFSFNCNFEHYSYDHSVMTKYKKDKQIGNNQLLMRLLFIKEIVKRDNIYAILNVNYGI